MAVISLVFSALPSTIGGYGGWRKPLSVTQIKIYEIGTDIQELPPNKSGLFLPFIKYEYGYEPGSRGLFLYNTTVLQDYGLVEAGKLTRISFMNMWGGQVYDHPDAGPQFIPGESDFLNFTVKLGLSTRTNATSIFDDHYDVAGPVTVIHYPGWQTIQGIHMNWMDFNFATDFDYDGTSSLVIEYEWDAIMGYNLGIDFGGVWDGQYAKLNGNLMTGLFATGYTGISWCPYAQWDYGNLYGPPDQDHLPVLQIKGEFEVPTVPATIDIDPDTLNSKSRGKWITGYIEDPEGYNVTDIDVSTVSISRIGGSDLVDPIYAEMHPSSIGDEDGDHVPDLMVKFDRPKVIAAILDLGYNHGDLVEITVIGALYDGTLFECSDTVKFLNKGK